MLVFRGASRRDSAWKMTNGNDQDPCVEDGDDCYRINDFLSFSRGLSIHINMYIYIYMYYTLYQ